jgi:hypothetical protein
LSKVPDAALNAALMILKNAGVFKWKDAVKSKGDAQARFHVGITAQSVETALSAVQLNPSSWGMFCSDTLGVEQKDKSRKRRRLGLRLDQVLLLGILALMREVESIKESQEDPSLPRSEKAATT